MRSMLLLMACKADPQDTALEWSYPMDDVLTLADVQALGTHNSYHVEADANVRPEWDYTHLPLDRQLGEQGVRQFELDVYWSEGEWVVLHVPLLDYETTCATFRECLEDMKGWSDRNPAHHPLATLVEVKDNFGESAPDKLAALDADLDAVWGDRLIVPDDVAVDTAGVSVWPTLGETRQKALFVLHAGTDWRATYTDGDTTAAGRRLFPDMYGDTTRPEIGHWSTLNDAYDSAAIEAALAAGHLVRTRTDGDGEEARANDTARRDTALASGANFVSTDFPAPHPDTGYVVQIPDGTPSRCNPLTAPADCTSLAIEDPAFIRP